MTVTPTVGTVMLDCADLDAVAGFWSELLGLEEKMRFPGYVWLGRVSEGGPSLAFQQVPEPKTVKNRMHLDLGSADPAAIIVRIEELGGSRIEDHEISGFHWTVMADPEGNEFSVAPAQG